MAVDLTTVQSAASWAQVTIPSPDTTNVSGNLQKCITAASIEFLRLTGRGPMNYSVPFDSPFVESVSYTELYNGNGNSEIYLRNMPVTAISAVTINGRTILPAADATGAGFQIGRTGQSIVLLNGAGGQPDTFSAVGRRSTCTRYGFPLGLNNVSVTYTAGFAPTTVTELHSIPTSGSNPLQITVASLALGLPWIADVGVTFFIGGAALTKVSIAPAAGQYYIVSPGVYLFNTADGGKQVLISYSMAGTPADIRTAVEQIVALNFKRRNWIGQESVAMKDVGSTKYSLLLDPEILRVVDYYKRRGVN